MNRQKREEALRNSGTSGKPSSDQPGRSNPPDSDQTQNHEDKSPEQHHPHREPGKLPLPE